MYRVDAPLAVRHRCSGFTLVEMLVVLAIAGLIAGLLYPQLQTAAFALQQRHAREQIAAGVESAHALAVRSGQPVVLVAAEDGAGLVVGNPAQQWRRFLFGPWGGFMITLRPQSITFSPDGSTTGGQLQLMSMQNQRPEAPKNYVIERETGRLREVGA